MENITVTSEIILRLRADAKRYEKESENSSDKFNKGYFEGKAEQNLKQADFLQSGDIDCLDDI